MKSKERQGFVRGLGDLQLWQLCIRFSSVLSRERSTQDDFINPRCEVHIFSTVRGCEKHNRICAISTGIPLTSLNNTNSEIFTKVWHAVKVIPQGGTLIFSSYVGSSPASSVHSKKYQEF